MAYTRCARRKVRLSNVPIPGSFGLRAEILEYRGQGEDVVVTWRSAKCTIK